MLQRATTKHPMYRFWSRVDKREDDECWPWIGTLNVDGYANLKIDGIAQGAHRFSYTIHKGEIPAGMCVRHQCDNPKCVNPAHLEVGTIAQNNQDRVDRNRSASGDRNGSRTHLESRPRGDRHHWQTRPWTRMTGDRNGRAKLSVEQIDSIRTRLAAGETVAALAREFGVSWTAVKYIKTGRSWKGVTL